MKRLLKLFIYSFILFYSQTVYSQYVSDFRVNDDTGNSYQGISSMDIDSAGNFIIVWEDQRFIPGILMYQRFNKFGTAQGNNISLNSPSDTIGYISPSVSLRNDGSFIVTWIEASINVNPVYKLRIFNKKGIAVSNVINIYDSTLFIDPLNSAKLCLFPDGKFNVIYSYISVGTSYNVYFQSFDSIGNKIGLKELVNDDTNNTRQKAPDVNVKVNDKFIIAWEDDRIYSSGTSDIFEQVFDSNGLRIGVNQKVNDDNDPNSPHINSSVSSDTAGNFTIAWLDSRKTFGSDFLVGAQNYNSDGTSNGGNYRVDQGLIYNRFNPKVRKREDGYFVIGWYDRIYGPMFQRFGNTNLFIGQQKIVSLQNSPNEKIFQDIAIAGDRVISVWQDNRNGNYDIYCNILSFQNPDSVINNITQISSEIPESFLLYQNYPNPFNPFTKIKYQLPRPGIVSLKLYSMHGKEISTLIKNYQTSGVYELTFNGQSLSSGVYFYELILLTEGKSSQKFTQIKKMILIK